MTDTKTWDQMTDREKDAWVETELFEHSVIEARHVYWFSPADCGWKLEARKARPMEGLNPDQPTKAFRESGRLVEVPHYTTDPAAALEVLSKLGRVWTCHSDNETYWIESVYGNDLVRAEGKTFSAAVCHLAYLANTGEPND